MLRYMTKGMVALIHSYTAWEKITCLPKANYEHIDRFALKI